ncbi:MAG: cupin domain-containing protein [Thiomicrorhabdus chilensis]|uniref:cupin domain-containing protein n=1 Tax=Thiomicrorhabdus chilensis TaxID=63656 RepID=UPI00299F33A8|nr:cupin domain-containing protein [Thiomicrorhabdus chilensis]MDX1348452.1 cupin domain-containing protein [Thiomicrorhabdus chilensis]
MIQFQEIDLKTFLSEYWQKKPLVIRNALPAFETPLSAEELAGLSLEEEVESRIVIQNGEQDYQLLKGPFDESTFSELPQQNWTLLIQGVDRLIPDVTDLLNDFDFLPRWRIDDIMISYATQGGNVGPHFDHYDVFLLQAAGKRRWQLTSQACSEDNYIQGVDLRLMKTFSVEEDYVFEAGDILYLPPKWGHHGVALDNECMTYSIGYRTYRGQELWDSFGDHLSEMNAFKELYIDPQWPENLNPGEVTETAVDQAQELLQSILQDRGLLKTWFGRFATQLDQVAAQQLPEPLTREETPSIEDFSGALMIENGLIKDPVCRFAYAEMDDKPLLYINGAIWNDFGAQPTLIRQIANQSFLTQEDLNKLISHSGNLELLFDLWKLQYWVFID